MKKSIIGSMFIVALSCTGCGEGQKLIDAPSKIVKDLLRIDKDKQVEQNRINISNLSNKLEALEAMVVLNNKLVNINADLLADYAFDILEVKNIILDLQNELSILSIEVTQLESLTVEDLTALQALLISIESSIAHLESLSHNNIVNIIDPCGDMVGHFDEIILELQDGTFLAYFEQGSHRFLSVLPDGIYQTTDKQKCTFQIINGAFSEL